MPTITGTPGDDFLVGTDDPDTINGLAGNDTIQGGGGDDTIDGGEGDDFIRGQAGADTIYGGDGNDTIYGGFTQGPGAQAGDLADYIDGGAGNDLIRGGDGNDTLIGGTGDDNLRGDAGNDTLNGGDGFDFISYRYDDLAVAVYVDMRFLTSGLHNVNDGRGGVDIVSNFEHLGLLGTALDDTLFGSTALKNQIYGGAGVDFITGGTQDDFLNGDDGNDTIRGNGGADTINGGLGDDFLSGGFNTLGGPQPGDLADIIDGGEGNDVIRGADGDDNLIGGLGDDNLRGDAGNDTMDGGDGFDFVSYRYDDLAGPVTVDMRTFTGNGSVDDGRGGTDTVSNVEWLGLLGTQADDTLRGSTTLKNQLNGNGGADYITGGELDDYIDGNGFGSTTDGNDTIYGNGGADELYGSAGDDLIFGGYGPTGAPQPGDLADTIDGGEGNDTLRGGDGNDNIVGGLGDDNLRGDAGDDAMDGGDGFDFLSYRYDDLAGPVFVDMRSFTGTGTLSDGRGGTDTVSNFEWLGLLGTGLDDTLRGSLTLKNQIFGGNGADQIFGGNADDEIEGGVPGGGTDGNDVIRGNGGADTIRGGAGDDTIYGGFSSSGAPQPGDGADTIDGGEGNDILRGGDGNDNILGGLGDDNLRGDAGDDTMDGGDGFDFLSYRFDDIATGPVNIDMSAFTGSGTLSDGRGGTDTVSNFEWLGLLGTESDDILRGSLTLKNQLTGLGGNDIIIGGALDDRIDGSEGNDTLTGGGGINEIIGGAGNDQINVTSADSGSTIDGGEDTDTLSVTGNFAVGGTLTGIEAIVLNGGAGLTLTADQFNGSLGYAQISGNGSLTVNMDDDDFTFGLAALNVLSGSTVALTINGSTGDDAIKGLGNQSTTMNGGEGDDQIRGGSRADVINGGDGADKLIGAGGADIMTGGAGADVFRYLAAANSGIGAAADRITDYEIGIDRLAFGQIDADPIAPGDQAFAFVGNGVFSGGGVGSIRFQNSGGDLLVQVDVDGNGTADMEIVLQGLAGGTLTAGDFVL